MKKKFLTFILSICFIIPAIFCLSACTQTPPDIQFKVENGYVQYYNGETWSNLIAVADLEGEDGVGVDGREVEFRKTSTHIQWRYVVAGQGANAGWTNLIALTELDGEDGREVEFRKTTTHIQWRYVDASQGADANWTNLIALTELAGVDGREIEFRKTTTHIQWRYVDASQGADANWTNLITIEELNGEDATYSTYTITYDYGKASDLFKTTKASDSVKSTEWVTTLPEIKDEQKDSFLGWFIQGTNKEVSNYDFVGGNVTLEARFDAEKLGLSGFYQQGKYVMTWNDLKTTYPDAFASNTEIAGNDGFVNYKSYLSSLNGEIVIDDSITKIGRGAFSGCKSLTNFILPNDLTSIGMKAFYECELLTQIKMPNSVSTLEDNAFSECTSLKYVELPEGLESTGNWTFYGCTNLLEVKIPNTITTIGGYSFAGCSNLKFIKLPVNLTTIMGYAFEDCSSITEMQIPNSVTTISHGAFSNCSITELTIPENLQQIYASTFSGLKDLEIINYNAVSLADITYNSAVDVFGNVGYNVDTLTINIGSKVERIPNYLFDLYRTFTDNQDYDTKLVVNFQNAIKLQSIGCSAFSHCETIESIILSNHIKTIDEYAFGYCYELTKIYFYGTEEEFGAIDIGEADEYFTNATKYYYSIIEPTDEGNYWHYDVDGKTPIAW